MKGIASSCGSKIQERNHMTENLRIGVPSKGRLADISTQLLKDAGLSFRRRDRSL